MLWIHVGGITDERIVIIPIKEKKPIELIYIGRLEKVKGVQNILKGLKDSSLQYHLLVVGDGSFTNELKQLCYALDLYGRVDFLGRRTDVPELLSKADVFIHLPDWEEGFGIAIVEAMASGLVCICGEVGAIPEIIDNNIDGFLVDKNHYHEIDLIISDVIKNSLSEEQDIRRNAIKKAEKFSIAFFTKNLDQIGFT